MKLHVDAFNYLLPVKCRDNNFINKKAFSFRSHLIENVEIVGVVIIGKV